MKELKDILNKEQLKWVLEDEEMPIGRARDLFLNNFIRSGNLECLKIFLNDSRLSHDLMTKEGLLQTAATSYQDEIMEFLIMRGHEIDTLGSQSAPILYAAQAHNGEGGCRMATLLLSHKADIRAKWTASTDSGNSVLHFVNSIELAKLFLKHGAEVDSENSEKIKSSDCYTYYNGREDCMALIKIAEKLLKEAETKSISEATLKELGDAVNGRNAKDGDTALHIAVKNKDVSGAKLLLKSKASSDITNNKGYTAVDLGLNELLLNSNVEEVEFVIDLSGEASEKEALKKQS